MTAKRLRVLIVDDSRAFKKALMLGLANVPLIEVVGEASDGLEAVSMAETLRPDVISMDVIMPRCTGIEAAQKILSMHYVPIVLLTSMARLDEQWMALNALRAGVVEVANKPALVGPEAEADLQVVIRALLNAGQAGRAGERRTPQHTTKLRSIARPTRVSINVVGSSTGGPAALEKALKSLHAMSPPTVIGQHLAPGLSASFAKWLGGAIHRPVALVDSWVDLIAGHVYLAADHCDLEVKHGRVHGPGASDRGKVAPNIDRLFRSCAASYGKNALGIILTGMGSDGVDGMLELRNVGAWTAAQDRASCVVYGMPCAAVERQACQEVLSLEQIAEALKPIEYMIHGAS